MLIPAIIQESLFSSVSGLALEDIYKFMGKNLQKIIYRSKDEYLNYELGHLAAVYAQEPASTAFNFFPYAEIINLLYPDFISAENIKIEIQKDFELKRSTAIWEKMKESGYQSLFKSGRIKENEQTIRLNDFNTQQQTLYVSKATYEQQARSNLILDYPNDKEKKYFIPGQYTTLRNLLVEKYGNKLPDLSDKRMANTIGIACMIFYKDKKQWVPYFVKRVNKLGVFPGGIHCTASGVARWPKKELSTFSNFFTVHMLSEIEEEVGLKKDDIENLVPVALCREFVRGGKPQLFYAATTNLSRLAIKKKRMEARRVIKNVGAWQEIQRDRWFRSGDVVLKKDTIQAKLYESGVTHEALAAYYYGLQYLARLA